MPKKITRSLGNKEQKAQHTSVDKSPKPIMKHKTKMTDEKMIKSKRKTSDNSQVSDVIKIENDEDKPKLLKRHPKRQRAKQQSYKEVESDNDLSPEKTKDDDYKEEKKQSKKIAKRPKKKLEKSLQDDTNSTAVSSKVENANDSESDWENVETSFTELLKQSPMASTSGEPIEITIDKPKSEKELKIEEFAKTFVRRLINRFRKNLQFAMHKMNLMCSMWRLLFLSRRFGSNKDLRAVALENIPNGYINIDYKTESVERFVKWFSTAFTLQHESLTEHNTKHSSLVKAITKRTADSALQLCLMFVICSRAVGLSARLVMSLQPVPIKLPEERMYKGDNASKQIKSQTLLSTQLDKSNEKSKKKSSGKMPDKPFGRVPKPVINDKDRVDYCCEVFDAEKDRWIVIDVVHSCLINDEAIVEFNKYATEQVHYVFAVDENHRVRDVTARYVGDALMAPTIRKLRVDCNNEIWYKQTKKAILKYAIKLSKTDAKKIEARERMEELQFKTSMTSADIPKRVSDFKNHPLYALDKDLLKFQAIYPRDQVPLGTIGKYKIYNRSDVYTLCARDKWAQQARQIKSGEDPYKVVQARPKPNVPKHLQADDRPLPLYGPWQTEPYKAPPAKDGVIPRNQYGNVELFHASMLPAGTVHLTPYPRLLESARKVDVDCAAAMVGWDVHGGRSHPMLDGWVVCKEHVKKLLAAYEIDEEKRILREAQKMHEEAIENWKRLTKSLLIRDKLKRKANFEAKVRSRKNIKIDDFFDEVIEHDKVQADDDQPTTTTSVALDESKIAWPQVKQHFTL